MSFFTSMAGSLTKDCEALKCCIDPSTVLIRERGNLAWVEMK